MPRPECLLFLLFAFLKCSFLKAAVISLHWNPPPTHSPSAYTTLCPDQSNKGPAFSQILTSCHELALGPSISQVNPRYIGWEMGIGGGGGVTSINTAEVL